MSARRKIGRLRLQLVAGSGLDGRAGDRRRGSPRLLFVSNEAYFLLSHRLAVAKAAQDAGWEVHIAAPPDHVWAPPGFSVAQFETLGFFFHPVPLSRRGRNLLGEFATLLSLVRLYRRLRPHLVHHLTIKPNLYGGLAARAASVPAVVSTVTGLGQLFVGGGLGAAALRSVVGRLLAVALHHPNSRVIFQNADDQRRLVGMGIVAAAAAVLIRGSGVDTRRFRPLAEPKGPPVVALCARLIWEKGVAVFVEAARLLRGRGVSARFVLVGDTQPSNPRSVPAATLRGWEKEGVAEWWGYREDMNAVFASCHIVCLPSTYGEGVPKVLLEAAACGRPVVTTDHSGCRDAVWDGVTGLLVPPGDAAALADALHRLIGEASVRRSMGEAGRVLVEREFDERDIAERTLQVYSALTAAVPHKPRTR